MADEHIYLDRFRDDIYRMVPPDGKVIGSVGCGKARTEARLVDEGREVHGVDLSDTAIAIAADRLTSARVVAPGDYAPFAQASLDGLILADVVEHLPEAWDALRELVKMVRPGGWVAISVPNMRYLLSLKSFVLGGDWPEDEMGIFDRTHLQVMSHKRLHRWAEAAGLVLEREFDTYDHRFAVRNAARLINRLLMRLPRSFLTFQVQALYRRT